MESQEAENVDNNAQQDVNEEFHNNPVFKKSKPFTIERAQEKRATKYGMEEITFRAKFNQDFASGQKLLDSTDNLQEMFEDILENVNSEHDDPNDRARVTIKHSGLDRDIVVHCQPRHNITSDVIMDRLVKIFIYLVCITHFFHM